MKEIFSNARSILFAPKEFFVSIAKNAQVKPITIYLIVMSCVAFLLQIASVIFVQPSFNKIFANLVQMPVTTGELNPNFIVPSFLSSVVIGFFVSLLLTTVLHFWLRLFTKAATWKDTYSLYVYSQTPVFLLSWLPLLNTIGWIYSVYLMVVGIQKTHNIDRKTALLVIVLPIALLFIVSTLVMLIAFSNLKG